jgi:ribosomal-protein-alanine N-acetyltransferase
MVRIRELALADLDRVMGIARSLKEAPHWPRGAFVDALNPQARPPRIALAAEDPDGEVVGFSVAVLVEPQAELEVIAVAAEAQRRGIARLLFSELSAQLKKMQITEVLLEGRASNTAALALYRSLGFVESGRRLRYYAEPQEDAVLMHLVIG